MRSLRPSARSGLRRHAEAPVVIDRLWRSGLTSVRVARLALAAGAIGLCVAMAGCGGSGSGSAARSTASATVAGSPASANPVATADTVRVADCRLWQVLDRPARGRLLAAMHTFFGGPVDYGNGHGGVLDAAHATRLFDNYCRLPFARAFKLYKLYGRAAAFTPPSG